MIRKLLVYLVERKYSQYFPIEKHSNLELIKILLM